MASDMARHKNEFLALLEVIKELYSAVADKKPPSKERLNKTRAIIEHCDYIVSDTHGKQLLVTAASLWNACLSEWYNRTSAGEGNDGPMPLVLRSKKPQTGLAKTPERRTLDEELRKNENDRRFLRSLKIKVDDN